MFSFFFLYPSKSEISVQQCLCAGIWPKSILCFHLPCLPDEPMVQLITGYTVNPVVHPKGGEPNPTTNSKKKMNRIQSILQAISLYYRWPFRAPGSALARARLGPLIAVSCLARPNIKSGRAVPAHGLYQRPKQAPRACFVPGQPAGARQCSPGRAARSP